MGVGRKSDCSSELLWLLVAPNVTDLRRPTGFFATGSLFVGTGNVAVRKIKSM